MSKIPDLLTRMRDKLPANWFENLVINRFNTIFERLDAMSASIEQQIQTATATITAKLGTVDKDVTAMAEDIVSLQNAVANAVPAVGEVVTQATVDALMGAVAGFDPLVAKADAIVASVQPAAPAQPAA
jgi:hypothetical protein